MDGMLRRAAAISIPGTILSQFGMSTRPSNWCACASVSTLSAISSRLGREYFMPMWPMAMPSHTPIAGTMTGVPPAMRTPALAASAILSRLMWPGMISLYAETTPMIGFFISSSVRPQARSSERLGMRSAPAVMLSLLLDTGDSSFLRNRRAETRPPVRLFIVCTCRQTAPQAHFNRKIQRAGFFIKSASFARAFDTRAEKSFACRNFLSSHCRISDRIRIEAYGFAAPDVSASRAARPLV